MTHEGDPMPLAHPGLDKPEYYVPGLPRDWVAQRYGIPADQIAETRVGREPAGSLTQGRRRGPGGSRTDRPVPILDRGAAA